MHLQGYLRPGIVNLSLLLASLISQHHQDYFIQHITSGALHMVFRTGSLKFHIGVV